MYESDGSDSGADLLDFIVDDDAVISSVRGVSTSPTTASPPASRKSTQLAKAKPFYVPIHLTQDSDDDLPSMSQLGGNQSKQSKGSRRSFTESDSEAEDIVRKPAARKKKRAVIQDTDSESD